MGISIYLSLSSAIPEALKVLDQLRVEVIGSKLAAFGSLAATLAGLLTAFVLLKISHDYIEGQGITMWSILRPFAILLLVANFNSFVATPVHHFANIFTKGMTKQASATAADFRKQFGQIASSSGVYSAIKTIIDNENNNTSESPNDVKQEENTNWFNSFLSKIAPTVTAIVATAKVIIETPQRVAHMAFEELLCAILSFLIPLFIFAQQCTCYMYLIIYSLLGPFSFAFAILPSFRNNIASWLARYIHTCLWIPVAQLILYINLEIMKLGPIVKAYNPWILDVCLVVCLFSLFSVPKICSYIISSDGTSGAEPSAKSVASTAAATGAKVAAAVL